ncbi:MAG: OmpA family protein [Leeuwenhoekiella sp.]
MKKSYILYIFLFLSQFSWSQEKSLKQANRLFAQKDFYSAIEAYESIDEKSEKALLNLADSYYYTGMMAKADSTYTKLAESYPETKKTYSLRFADAAKANDNYDNANSILTSSSGNKIDILGTFNKDEESLPQIYKTNVIDASASSSDFGPAYYDRQLVFASDRNTERPVYGWTNKPFLDLYYGKISGTTITDEGLFPGEINTDLHESNVVFTSDGQHMYFTRNNDGYKRVDGEKIAVLQIYKADLINGKWINIHMLPINNDSYSIAHPALSPDDKTLYFSSDMPGGLGSYDIYKVAVLSDDNYGEPQNLGSNVNSDQREQFPYISEWGNLYFASDRYTGLGGLDLFKSEREGDSFEEAFNLGTSINSNRDDFSLITKERQRTGYFSSNRTGKDKLYRFDAFNNKNHIVVGIVKDATTGKALPGTTVSLLTVDDKVLKDTVVGNSGTYKFAVRPNANYKLKGSKELYSPTIKELNIAEATLTESNIDLALLSYDDQEEMVNVNDRNQLTQINLDKIFFDFDKSTIRPDAAKVLNGLVALMKKHQEMEIEVSAHTDARGSDGYNQSLSEQRAASTLEYLVKNGIERNRLQSKGYGETQLINDCGATNCTAEEAEENRRCEFTILK